MNSQLKQHISESVAYALSEDLGGEVALSHDITANLIPQDKLANANIITREHAIFCGKAWVEEVFAQLGNQVEIEWQVEDGDTVEPDQVLFRLSGNARAMLAGERVALNFVQSLSATATVTNEYLKLMGDSSTRLLDTRKTIPGMRLAQKYAVTCGGGHNHRIGLFDAFLIKENHIMACEGIDNAVSRAKEIAPGKPVEVEVESLDELQLALNAGADIVMLDNFSIPDIQQAISLAKGKAQLEVSGNITKESIRDYSSTNVDFISIGALTKHVRAVDLSMRLKMQ